MAIAVSTTDRLRAVDILTSRTEVRLCGTGLALPADGTVPLVSQAAAVARGRPKIPRFLGNRGRSGTATTGRARNDVERALLTVRAFGTLLVHEACDHV